MGMAYFTKFEYTILTAIWKDISIKPVKNYDAWFGYIQRTLSFLIFTFIKQLKENSDKKVMESETKSEWQRTVMQPIEIILTLRNKCYKFFSNCTKSHNPSKRNKNNRLFSCLKI